MNALLVLLALLMGPASSPLESLSTPAQDPAPRRSAGSQESTPPAGDASEIPEDPEDEVEPVDEVLDQKQVKARLLYARAGVALEKKRKAEATTLCEQAHQSDPRYSPPILLRARLAFDQRQYRLAEAWYTRALNLDPRNPDLLIVVAQCHIELEEYGAAESLLDIAAERGFDTAQMPQVRARVMLSAERWDEAEKLLLELHNKDPQNADIRALLLEAYEGLENYPKALPLAYKMMQQSPKDRSSRHRYIHLLLRSELWEVAAREMESALSRDPTDQGTRKALITVYDQMFPNPDRKALHQSLLKRLSSSEKEQLP